MIILPLTGVKNSLEEIFVVDLHINIISYFLYSHKTIVIGTTRKVFANFFRL